MNSLSEPRYDIQKQVNVYRAILKTNIFSENVVRSQFTEIVLIFSIHAKFDVNVSVSPKKMTFENK